MPVFNIALDNGTATYTLEGTNDKAKVLDTAEDAARYLYPIRWQLYEEVGGEQVPILFDDLTNPQKLAIIAKEFKYIMIEYAETYNAISKTDAAREAAVAESEIKYDL